jgi:SAM-dependent methyltransferase
MSANPVLDAVFGRWRASVITTACRLGVFSLLERGPSSAETLARDLGCVPRLLEALLDACVGVGLLRREGRSYANTELSRTCLVESNPQYLGHILEVQAREAARWAHLLELVRTGEAPRVRDDVSEQDPLFTLAMNDLGAQGEAEALAAAVDLSRCRTLVDLGCGSGVYAVALCRRNPGLTATLVDREEVLRTTGRLVAATDVAPRIQLRAGDMTTALPITSVDAVLLSDSLYYDEPISQRVLRSVHAALNPGGTLVIRGYYPDPGHSEAPFGAAFRLNLLLFDPERSPPTIRDLAAQMAQTGFREIRWFALTERSTCFTGAR